MKRIAVDPGLRHAGIAALDGLEVIAGSVFETERGDGERDSSALVRRAGEVGARVGGFARTAGAKVIAIEAMTYPPSAPSAAKLAASHAAVATAARLLGAELRVVPAGDAKAALVGHRTAGKRVVERAARRRVAGAARALDEAKKGVREHLADAIAVGFADAGGQPMRPLLLGEAPARSSAPGDQPFDGRCAAFLEQLAGFAMSEAFALQNLLEEWPGPAAKGSAFPEALARDRARLLAPELDGRAVVLAGQRVAAAFRVRGVALGAWVEVEIAGALFEATVLPHPSGVNRWWNEQANRRAGARFLRSFAPR